MGATRVEIESMNNVGDSMGDQISLESLRDFAKLLAAFLRCDGEIRDGIASMAAIVIDPDASEDEIEAALDTVREGLFPSHSVDLDATYEPTISEAECANQMDQEEAQFASTLARHMRDSGKTQEQLAKAIGIGQSAISMMLSRKCRPQRRTVEKLSVALGVSPEELWPSYKASKPLATQHTTAVVDLTQRGVVS
jgi:lambda repressor-like predicted transcriptional regulator